MVYALNDMNGRQLSEQLKRKTKQDFEFEGEENTRDYQKLVNKNKRQKDSRQGKKEYFKSIFPICIESI